MEEFKFHGYIYITINQQENKCYVGQKSISPNKSKNYLGSGTLLNRKIKKYGEKFFKKIILGEIFSNDINDFKRQLDECENECIYFFRAYGADGENYDHIYGYNLTKKARTTLGLPSEIRKEAGRKFRVKYKLKSPTEIKMQVNKRAGTIKNNPQIEVDRVLNLQQTLKDDPSINIKRVEKRKDTIEAEPWRIDSIRESNRNPEYKKKRADSRNKTIKEDPSIMKNSGVKCSKTWGEKSEEEKIQKGKNISIGKANMPQDEKDRVNKDISNTLKNKSREERDIINRNTRQKYIDDPLKKERASIKSKATKKAKKENMGKSHPLYIKLDYIVLIDLFFSGITNSKILTFYSTTTSSIITNTLLKRFLNVLDFPVPMNSTINKEIRLKFIKENEYKIQWYKDNYERLEEEYFLKLFNNK